MIKLSIKIDPINIKMMKSILFSLTTICLLMSCQLKESNEGILVSNAKELQDAISKAQPGTSIIMANGQWENVEIRLVAKGTEDQPITLRAETPGEVIIQGQSDLKLGGEYLVVDGLYFTNGASPSESVIQFFINKDTLANNSRVTNCVIKDFNKAQRNMTDLLGAVPRER